MLIFYGLARAKKEKIPKLEAALIPFLKNVAKEDGIIDFKVFRQNDEPTRYLFYETYRDQKAFDIHRKTKHVDAMFEVLQDSLAEEPIRGFWEEVASIQPPKNGLEDCHHGVFSAQAVLGDTPKPPHD